MTNSQTEERSSGAAAISRSLQPHAAHDAVLEDFEANQGPAR
jgi:hypothetical protein